MALDMRDCMGPLSEGWRRRGHCLGFGIGIAQGYTTLGPIGYEGRTDYAAIGSVPNLASRLCDEAKAGQILVSQRVLVSLGESVQAGHVGDLTLKGFHRAVPAFEISRWSQAKEAAHDSQQERMARDSQCDLISSSRCVSG